MDGDKSLVIKNVVPGDEGTYICEAHNSVGQISSKAQLIVNCKYIFSITHPPSSLIDGRAWQNLLLVMFQQLNLFFAFKALTLKSKSSSKFDIEHITISQHLSFTIFNADSFYSSHDSLQYENGRKFLQFYLYFIN